MYSDRTRPCASSSGFGSAPLPIWSTSSFAIAPSSSSVAVLFGAITKAPAKLPRPMCCSEPGSPSANPTLPIVSYSESQSRYVLPRTAS